MAKHSKIDSIHSGGGGYKRIVAGVATTEHSSQKRSMQLAYSSHGSSVPCGPERTPKTPQTANVFRRKWGGASSTKSQKSVSSTRSAGLNQVNSEHNSTGLLHTRSARHGEETNKKLTIVNENEINQNLQPKRKKSRPNSSSKPPVPMMTSFE